MHRIGLKLWSTNTGEYFREAGRLHAQGGLDYVELYIVPGSLAALSAWRELKVRYVIHCPHSMDGFNAADVTRRESNRQLYQEVKCFADELNSDSIIFHPGTDGTIEEAAEQLSALREPRMLIENKPLLALPNPYGKQFCRGGSVEELEYILAKVGARFCLDFGHAVCAANTLCLEPYGYIERLLQLSPAMFHLSDLAEVSSPFDSHLHLGEGQLAIGRVMALLPPESTVTLETPKVFSDSLEDFCADCTYFRHFEWNMRRAAAGDCLRIFELSNDDEVRANSFQSELIGWETHRQWYVGKLHDRDSCFYVVENVPGDLVAQIRFEKSNVNCATVSLSISKDFRGKSLGRGILRMGCDRYRAEFPNRAIYALIKKDNIRSLSCFQHAGFRIVSRNPDFVRLVYES